MLNATHEHSLVHLSLEQDIQMGITGEGVGGGERMLCFVFFFTLDRTFWVRLIFYTDTEFAN